MSKTHIGWLYCLSLIFEIILIIIFFPVYTSVPDVIQQDQEGVYLAQQQIQLDQTAQYQQGLAQAQQKLAQDQQTQAQENLPGIVTMLSCLAAAGMLGMIAWVGALINLSRGEQWAWFILMFFFGGITLLIYLIGGPAVPQAGKTPVPRQHASGLQVKTPVAVSTQMSSSPVPQLPQQQSALDVLQLRFARGEIDAATYQQMRDTLTR